MSLRRGIEKAAVVPFSGSVSASRERTENRSYPGRSSRHGM